MRNVVIPRIKKGDTPTPLAPMSLDITREITDLPAPRAACVLQKRAVPTGAATALDAHARDVLSVPVPPIVIDPADAARERPGDVKVPGTLRGSATVDSEWNDEVDESGEDEETEGSEDAHRTGDRRR